MDDVLLTAKEVAARLRLSVQTVHELIKKGTLPAFDVGTRVRHLPRVREKDLVAFIERRKIA